MTLEELRNKALFQNTIDTWIMLCEEKSADWYDTKSYMGFVSHLFQNGLKLQKFPLCIKESGGMYHRGKDKTEFAETLAQSSDPNAAAYTVKLSDDTIKIIRKFSPSAVA
ncbi:MAG: hypothetical protein E6K93_07020 [Thaumarchaeota archaeon]|nr:MAG: hypothetical protein AUI61_00330 [Thaumarchaeota archaeon 13_1_40CM_2_39_13_2]OLE41030.1 MAG: hypothetical protein AUG16_01560 [Thaumarchaeota archaeon 13_1_20CM_2_39_20]TLX89098.1 MAG: hypothetical protein E6K93_07020 [Nitrososphaerota archaeon]